MIALPSLESFGSTPVDGPKNFVVIGSYLGLHQNAFYPKTIGKNYEMPDTLKPLAEHQHEFTVFSGLDHRAANGHAAWSNFLCGNSPKTYSLDQMVADKIGQKSRFASIQLTAGSGEANKPMCFTRQGVPLPMIQRPSVFYKQLFVSKEDRRRTEYVLRSGKSALDSVVKDAKRLQQ